MDSLKHRDSADYESAEAAADHRNAPAGPATGKPLEPAQSGVIAVDRAIGDLRRGGPVILRAGKGAGAVVMSPEFVTDAGLKAFRQMITGPMHLVLTAQRLRALALALPGDAIAGLGIPDTFTARRLRDLADPLAEDPAIGHAVADLPMTVADAAARASVQLAKLAHLLPAMLIGRLADSEMAATGARGAAGPNTLVTLDYGQIADYERDGATSLRRVSAAKVPLEDAEDTEIIAFRPASGGTEHLAIVIGAPDGSVPVLTRLHSQCFTGDLLGSLRCDCGEQLRGAVQAIAAEGSGVILYLAQEGRGIGLVNKLRAYQLQDQGLDTFDANQQLGFDDDERHYHVAAEMLTQLGFDHVRLLTNNPDKIAALGRFGITVVERVPHIFPSNHHNARYLGAKAGRGGHLL